MFEKSKNILNKIRKFLNWETFLFIFVNLAILTNIFPFLSTYSAYIGYFIIDNLYKSQIEGISVLIMLAIYLMPLFLVIKYLSLLTVILIIQKFSRNEEIKSLIARIFESKKYKINILLTAIIADIGACFVNFVICKAAGNYYYTYHYNTNMFWYVIFGGLTGSYVMLFICSFVHNKFRNHRKQIQAYGGE